MNLQKTLIGCVQGRLTVSPDGSLQRFPENWQNEIKIAKKLSLNFLEILVERKHNNLNPFWRIKEKNELIKIHKIENLDIFSVCIDYVIDNSLTESVSCQKYFYNFIQKCKCLNFKKIIIPLMEKSFISKKNINELKIILKNTREILGDSEIELCLEVNNEPEELLEFLKDLESEKVNCVFDTGNRILISKNIINDFKILKPYISHIHLKDRDLNGNNVEFGSGIVNFREFFDFLKIIKYKGSFVFETFKGEEPVLQMNKNIEKFKSFIS